MPGYSFSMLAFELELGKLLSSRIRDELGDLPDGDGLALEAS